MGRYHSEKSTSTQGVTASNVAAMIHLLSCCVQLNSPETQSEQKPGREGRSSSEPAQVHPPSDHNGNSNVPGAPRLGKPAHHTKPKSEQETSVNKDTEAMRHTTHEPSEPHSERTEQGSNNQPLNKQDGVNILGAVPLRRVPCSNTEGPAAFTPSDRVTMGPQDTGEHGCEPPPAQSDS